MNRRTWLGLSLAATGGIFVPRFGPWYRQTLQPRLIEVPRLDVFLDSRFLFTVPRRNGIATVYLTGRLPTGAVPLEEARQLRVVWHGPPAQRPEWSLRVERDSEMFPTTYHAWTRWP